VKLGVIRIAFLLQDGSMINKYYLNTKLKSEIAKVLTNDFSVQLYNFIDEKCSKLLKKKLKFKKVYAPNSFSYNISNFDNKGLLVELTNFLESIINKKIKMKSAHVYCFSAGDYILINNDSKEVNGIKVILELNNYWDSNHGGFTSFISNNKEILRINPVCRSLSIILTKKSMSSFIKYINHHSGNNKRYFLEIIYGKI